MVALDIRLRYPENMDTSLAPEDLARELIEDAEPGWLRELVDALDREVRTRPLERLISLWDLSNSAAARIFGVSRQAFSKWLVSGPPADRADDVARVDEVTQILDRYVLRERIPAVVRRQSDMLEGDSIVSRLEAGDYELVSEAVKRLFDLRRIQP